MTPGSRMVRVLKAAAKVQRVPKRNRRQFINAFAVGSACCAFPALGQGTWPTRPVRIVHGNEDRLFGRRGEQERDRRRVRGEAISRARRAEHARRAQRRVAFEASPRRLEPGDRCRAGRGGKLGGSRAVSRPHGQRRLLDRRRWRRHF